MIRRWLRSVLGIDEDLRVMVHLVTAQSDKIEKLESMLINWVFTSGTKETNKTKNSDVEFDPHIGRL